MPGLNHLLSAIHRTATGIRNFAFERHLLQPRRLKTPVISVGNLSVGGTGKTPICIYLHDQLTRAGLNPSILLRGYSIGGICDEARLYQEKFNSAKVFIGSDRFSSGQKAEADGFNVQILDDGFQHRKLHRDCDIVLIDCSEEPNSWFREGFGSLHRASIILLTRAEAGPFRRITRRLARFPNVPVFKVQFTPTRQLGSKKVFAFCGIGNPKSFLHTIDRADGHLCGSRFFRDHHEYTEDELAGLRESADQYHADLLLTTEKDLVRISDEIVKRLCIQSLPIQVEIDQGFMQAVCHQLGARI